ncbi:MAG: FtsX-like permease family protein [Methylococcales bacterium]
MNTFKLALRLLVRDYRSGELSILLIALIIAVTGSSAISLFADRLQRTMDTQAAEFLAADLVVSSSTPLVDGWQEKATLLGLKQAQTVEFTSVLIEHEQLLLAGIKAVSEQYPLRGYLKNSDSDYATEQKRLQGPEPTKCWVEKRVLSALGLKLGDQLTVGEKPLTISHIITYEPDKRGDMYSLSPRVMMNYADLPATQIIQPGSHVHYFFQYAGDPKPLLDFKAWLKPQLNPSQRILDLHEDRPEVGGALTRAERYLGLSSIVVVLIAGVAIAMTTRRYTERHFDAAAILRCLGCTQSKILSLYTIQIVVLGITACTIGCFFGWLAQALLMQVLHSLLPQQLAPPSWLSLSFGFITGMVILIGFALPPILRLQQVSALRVLRRELQPLPASAWFVYGLATSIIGILIWRYTHDLRMTTTIIGSGLGSLMLLMLLVYGLLSYSRRLLPHLNLTWRFGLQNLLQERQASISQILAFSITLMAMVLSLTVKNDLIDNWKQQLPENAPNHFALNIFTEQLPLIQQDIKNLTQNDSQYFPVVSGRLIKINDAPVQQRVSKESEGKEATERDLSLTWSATLPKDNTILGGNWWTKDPKPGLVSVEQKLADNLRIKLDDVLTFSIGSEQFTARVGSLRKVQWETMQPNFYMIFSPGSIENYAHTYMTSFYLSPQQKNFLNSLVKNYPSITVLEVDLILSQFKTILAQLTTAINYLFYLALCAGFTVLFAAVYATLDQRIYRGALMRTLGASSSLLNKTHVLEFCLLGLISGVLAIILAEVVTIVLYHYVLHLTYHPSFWLWLIVPLSAAGVISLTGYWGLRDVVKKAPLQVLQQL